MNIERQYLNLLNQILRDGVTKSDRTGTGTISVFGTSLRHKMSDGFPLLTTKKLSFHNIKHELLWFLSGSTNIKYLIENNVHIWTDDAYRGYKDKVQIRDPATFEYVNREDFEERILTNTAFGEKFGDLGPTYGAQWRDFHGPDGLRIDQIQELINGLNTNPDSRRLLVTAWNPTETHQLVLPPCHPFFQCWTREFSVTERLWLAESKYTKFDIFDFGLNNHRQSEEWWHNEIDALYPVPRRELSLSFSMRSVDTFLGMPYNIASYGLLLHMLADECDMIPGDLVCNFADTHIYLNHVDQVKEQLSRTPLLLPTVTVKNGINANAKDLQVINYQSHPAIKAELSVG